MASNDVLFSAASGYEIAYKAADGRLTLPESPEAYVIRSPRGERL